MNRILSKSVHPISKILFILGSYNFLAYLECIRSYALSKGHSDPDLSSVKRGSHSISNYIYIKEFPKIKLVPFYGLPGTPPNPPPFLLKCAGFSDE